MHSVHLLRVTLSTVLLLVGVSREQITSSGLLNSKAFGAQPRSVGMPQLSSLGLTRYPDARHVMLFEVLEGLNHCS
jgi:hypothetical protein